VPVPIIEKERGTNDTGHVIKEPPYTKYISKHIDDSEYIA